MNSEKNITGSEVVETADKRQYHINLAPGEVAENILFVGDPSRATRVKDFFTEVNLKRKNREFVTYTGVYNNKPITVMATGIGPSNVEIAMVELSRVVKPNVIIRVGTCGSLQPHIKLGDLVVSTGAVRLEDTSLRFVGPEYPSIAHHEVIFSLINACKTLDYPYHTGITAAASGFYGAQGREVPGFPVNNPSLPDELAKRNVANFEMESSTLFTLASIIGWRAGTVCTVYANRPNGTFIPADFKEEAEKRCILAGLKAATTIDEMKINF